MYNAIAICYSSSGSGSASSSSSFLSPHWEAGGGGGGREVGPIISGLMEVEEVEGEAGTLSVTLCVWNTPSFLLTVFAF